VLERCRIPASPIRDAAAGRGVPMGFLPLKTGLS
jgi:hypothetical protein